LTTLRYLFADHLSRGVAALRDLDPASDVVLMTEVAAECTYVPHHPKKIAFLLSAMRHFAAELAAEGIRVEYVRLDDPANSQSFSGEIRRAVARHRPRRIVLTEPGEWRVLEEVGRWSAELGLPVEIRDDDRFFLSRRAFADWARGKRLRMENFYRWMRARTGILMTPAGEPEGGRWNFDAENRKRAPDDLVFPRPLRFPPDPVTTEVLDLVRSRFSGHFGSLEGFGFAVTRSQALAAFDHFLATGLARFGDYQDAMRAGEAWLFHSALSPYLNAGLLLPEEVCRRVEAEWRAGRAPLNSVEGFIRQILGWREYVRGVYWTFMPDYAQRNALGADRPLPSFYWTGRTDMACVRQAIEQTRREALSHHIQRLMITGNLALLLGVRPAELCEWYLAVYADAFEWVELPNTLGMALHADGGIMGSKPYAASGAYVDRMSDLCRQCRFDVRQKNGPEACPFNYLYWDFLIAQRARLGKNPRLAQAYRTLDRFPPERIARIRADAARFRAEVCSGDTTASLTRPQPAPPLPP
jgi:deoxyribodipyrimidine photolyase-related protein